jgi:hypothetical protein
MFTNSLSFRTVRTPLLGMQPVSAVEEIIALVLSSIYKGEINCIERTNNFVTLKPVVYTGVYRIK